MGSIAMSVRRYIAANQCAEAQPELKRADLGQIAFPNISEIQYPICRLRWLFQRFEGFRDMLIQHNHGWLVVWKKIIDGIILSIH
jgi:hypothetical protein